MLNEYAYLALEVEKKDSGRHDGGTEGGSRQQ
jgi:hypothetical protein